MSFDQFFESSAANFQLSDLDRAGIIHLCKSDCTVYLDIGTDGELLKLLLISYDGFGCQSCEQVDCFTEEESREIQRMVQSSCVPNAQLDRIICNYLHRNRSILWEDALLEHELIPPQPQNLSRV